MNCNHVQNLLSAFIDDELSAQEKRELRRHLFLCSECHSEYQSLMRVKECLNNLNQICFDYDSLAGLKVRINETEHSFFQETSRFWILGRLGLVTGCVTLFFFSTIALFPKNSADGQLAQSPRLITEYSVTAESVEQPETATTTIESSFDPSIRNFSLDEPVTVYQASSIILP